MVILTPAYGRKYKDINAAYADWEAGKDFKIAFGPYTSIRDIDTLIDQFGEVYLSYDYTVNSYRQLTK